MTTLSISTPEAAPSSSWKTGLLHHAAAWGAALCALTPLIYGWVFKFALPGADMDFEWKVRIWPGHLLIDSLQIVGFALAGLVAGGWWWWSAGWQRGRAGTAGSLGLLGLGILGVCNLLPHIVFRQGEPGEFFIPPQAILAAGVGGYVLWGLVCMWFFPRRRETRIGVFLKQHRPWNAIFFVSFVLLCTAGDVLLSGTAPPGWLAKTGFIIGRFLTQLVLASSIWMLLYLSSRWLPRGTEWVGWMAVVLTPLLVVVDIALRMMWTKGIYLLCTEIENGGKVDVLKIVEGGGVSVTPGQIAAAAFSVSIAPAWYFLSRYWSGLGGMRSSTLRFGGIALVAWFSLFGLQAVEAGCKTTRWRLWESRECSLQLTPFAPPPGLATFTVTATDPVLSGPGDYSRKPDIYFFIVETMRADAIAPERTPFFARWRDEECQQIQETRSAANATHLSWFSMLHGRLPYYEEINRAKPVAAPVLSTLRKAGYHLEFRTSGNMDYCDMLRGNFGDGTIMDVQEHVPEGHPDYGMNMGERETMMMEKFQASVDASRQGGTFRLTALNTAHYPYKWDERWTPPYSDYEMNPLFPVRPSPEEVERVRRRYWNAVAWNDHLIGKFINHLKETGRYDSSMIILTGDHGEEFKEHGSWFHCSALNEQQTRVPILIKWPKEMGRGPALKSASHLDLVPSILEAAGYPETAWQGMPGRSLYQEKEATTIINTCYAGQNGETMLWRRDGWEAAFSWARTWELRPPDRIWLERLHGPTGPVECPTPEAYEAELRAHFPDAFGRLFTTCERVVEK